LPKSGRLHREPLVAVMSHFHEESSLLCELSHIRKRRTANTLPQCQVSYLKGASNVIRIRFQPR
jgi:hypothetical protein